MTETQRELIAQANRFLDKAGCRWDGRMKATKPERIAKAKAQAGFERAQVVCPFSGRSTRKR